VIQKLFTNLKIIWPVDQLLLNTKKLYRGKIYLFKLFTSRNNISVSMNRSKKLDSSTYLEHLQPIFGLLSHQEYLVDLGIIISISNSNHWNTYIYNSYGSYIHYIMGAGYWGAEVLGSTTLYKVCGNEWNKTWYYKWVHHNIWKTHRPCITSWYMN